MVNSCNLFLVEQYTCSNQLTAVKPNTGALMGTYGTITQEWRCESEILLSLRPKIKNCVFQVT